MEIQVFWKVPYPGVTVMPHFEFTSEKEEDFMQQGKSDWEVSEDEESAVDMKLSCSWRQG